MPELLPNRQRNCQEDLLLTWRLNSFCRNGTVAGMVTHRPRRATRQPQRRGRPRTTPRSPLPETYFYIGEWIEATGNTLEGVAGKMGVVRQTIWKYTKPEKQSRLRPHNLWAIARAIGIHPAQFYFPPAAMPPRLFDAIDVVKQLTYQKGRE